METIKPISEGEAKDMILKYALENKDRAISSSEIKKIVLKNLEIDDINYLLRKIYNIDDQVADVHISDINCSIIATGITKKFLEQGGFTQYEKNKQLQILKENERQRIEQEKASIELRLKKWQIKTFWWVFVFAVIGSILSIYNFINIISPSQSELKQDEKILKIESELSKLQILISNQKNDTILNIYNSEKNK